MKDHILFILSILLLHAGILNGQNRPLPDIERELQAYAADILEHESLEHKIEQNRRFSRLLIETLRRPESYAYPFDSLKTISILSPADESFRIFTWYIVNSNPDVNYGEEYHYYFGLVQRRYANPDGRIEYLVIPLIELQDIPLTVENTLLDNNNWLGALYYQPRYHDHLPAYTLKYYSQQMEGSKPKRVKQTFYLLLGWNGSDNRSNFKVAEVMSFDPRDKNRVIFGADVFYFDMIPKYRAVFKYSEYAPFNLNFAWVKTGPFNLFKKKMIVYDHLAAPRDASGRMQEIWEYGPDGSYDALSYYSRGGYFEWYRNVRLAEKYNRKVTQRRQEEIKKREEEKLREAGIELNSAGAEENP